MNIEAWLFVPFGAANCELCGHVWPTGAHLTEGLAHYEVCPMVERICEECGDDLASEGLPFCMDCLEANPDLLP